MLSFDISHRLILFFNYQASSPLQTMVNQNLNGTVQSNLEALTNGEVVLAANLLPGDLVGLVGFEPTTKGL